MLRTLIAGAALLGVIATTSLAHAQAQELGAPGEFIISADRLVPLFAYTRLDQHALPENVPAGDTGASTTTSGTAISVLWGQNTQDELFYTVPRAGFDYVILPNVTLGGDIALYFTLGSNASTKTTADDGITTTTSGGDGGLFLFGVAPRGGYILRMTRSISLWLRGGISFYTLTENGPKLNAAGAFDRTDFDQLALDIDPQLVITPVQHLGLTAGLTTDIPLAGEHATKEFSGTGTSLEQSAGQSELFFGVTLGLIGYF